MSFRALCMSGWSGCRPPTIAPSGIRRPTKTQSDPVLCPEAGDAVEVLGILRDQSEPQGQRVRSDERVEPTDRRSFPGQRGCDDSEAIRGGAVEGYDRHGFGEGIDETV